MAKEKAVPCGTCNGHGPRRIDPRTGRTVGCDWRNIDAHRCPGCYGTGGGKTSNALLAPIPN